MLTTEMEDYIKKIYEKAVEHGQSINKNLDFSDKSIVEVEGILDYYSKDLKNSDEARKPTDNQIKSVATIWGIYLGETMRRKVGEGCIWEYNKEQGFYITVNGADAFPINKAYRRIVLGSEDNIISFYEIITDKLMEN
ncbi:MULTISPECIES: hypothetical protein [Clostridium]|uniref:Uncharacterized protein n=1 Tax=Clostridium cibarium TaxID=2762247 RepID=A0ABR8PYQ8_9CLOT|nr:MULTISPECIES: hypothetical protein [Clostridium]MBD7913267.1 hypothetical protein [Clostridium cibarium]